MRNPSKARSSAFRSKLGFLAQHFRSQAQLAGLLEVDRSRVSRWLESDMPDSRNRNKVEAIEFVLSRLTSFLTAETAQKWLLGVNAHLGGQRPVDLLRQGRVAEVIAAVEQLETGAFA